MTIEEDDTEHRMRLVPASPRVYAVEGAVIMQCTPEQAGVIASLLAIGDPDLSHELRAVKARMEMRMVPFHPASPAADR
jgi:hypothetical protein